MSGNSKIRGVFKATETTFATDPDLDGSSYRFVHAADIQPAPDFGEAIERTVQDNQAEHAGIVVGAQGGTFSHKSEVKGPGSAAVAASTIAASRGEEGKSLKAILGSERLGTGTTFLTGWASTGVGSAAKSSGDVTSAAGINVGDCIYKVNADGRRECRPVTGKTGATIEVQPPWTAEPVADDVCYAMANYGAQTSGQEYESVVLDGDTFMHSYHGCIGDLTVEALNARALPMFGFNYLIDTVVRDASADKTSLPASTDSFPAPPVVRRAPLYFDNTETLAAELSFTLGNERQPQLATSGAQGRAGWRVLSQEKTLTAKVYYAAQQLSDYESGTVFRLFFFLDGGLGNVFALYIPRCQIVASPGVSDISGQEGLDLALRALRSTVVGTPAAVLALG
jgi:hypothetical protein